MPASNLLFRVGIISRKLVSALAVTTLIVGASATASFAEGFWDQVKERGTLRCAFAASAPYMIKNVKNGEYSGTFLDICKSFAQVLKVQPQFVDTTWDNIVAGLQAGKWDLAPALNRTPERAMAINYSIPAVYDTVTIAYRTDNSKIKNPSPDLAAFDVAGVKIGVVTGTSNDFAATERFKNAEIVRLPAAEAVNLALLSGRVDAVASSIYINRVFQGANAANVAAITPEPPLTKNGVGFGLPASVSYQDVQVFNIFLEKLVAVGQTDASMAKYGDDMIAEAAAKK